FQSPAGAMFDGFGMDIESTQVHEYWVRSERAIELSKRLRRAVGPDYALGAIVLPPPLLDASPTYWPGFPFKELGRIYDVFLPMGYWTFRYRSADAAFRFTAASIEGIRKRTGRPAVPIHPIGGIADGVDAGAATAFVHAVREYGSIGASLYDVGTMDEGDWKTMAAVAPTPVQNPPSPLSLGRAFGAFGNIPAGDATHPRDVVFVTGRHRGAWELDLETFATPGTDISVFVNWRRVSTISSTLPGWSGRRTVRLPAGALSRKRNTVLFTTGTAAGPPPEWGVRLVSPLPGPLPATDRDPHGNLPGNETTRADRVTYVVPATGGLTTVTAWGFDVAAGEVLVTLDGQPLGLLQATAPGQWGLPQTFVVPAGILENGSARLTFDAVSFPPKRSTWGVRLMDASGLNILPGF
ncbi:MAG: hypothetical protein LC722_00760, partial [Actinobacteria bacterium]|nr:hypothetical protein [Actinomycetota bacterium]